MTRLIPPLMDLLGELIATPSVSSVSPEFDQGNLAVVDLLAGWLEDAGFAVEVMPIKDCPGKANLIATLGSGPGGLVLSGHTDTVPYDQGRWNQDPFCLTERDGRLYGLGTSDMKSFLALAIEAALAVQAKDLCQPLVILATADEESSMCGARALVDAGRPLGCQAVIGEPTGLRPVRLHKGIMMEAVRLVGHAGHSSDPSLGNSALEGMHELLGEILRWRSELQGRHRNTAFAVPVPTLNLGHIHGGDNPNRICPSCEVHFDLRPLPGMDIEALRAELRERVAKLAEQRQLGWEVRPLFSGIPAMETDPAAPIVRAAERLTGQVAEAVAFATEGPYLNQLGLETVILGPGDIAQAHQPDEFLDAARIGPTLRLLAGMIDRFCRASPP